jgi:Probable cobalt transporter subunit (CbtB)
MSQDASLSAPTAVPVVPLRELVPWAVFAGVVLLALLYLVGMDQGATSVISGSMLHEFMHDGRHLLGFPCH